MNSDARPPVVDPAAPEPAFAYERRKPEETCLHRVLCDNLETLTRVFDPSRGLYPCGSVD